MNQVWRKLAVLAWVVGGLCPMAGMAQEHGAHSAVVQPAADSMTEGVVKKVDPDLGKITIKHGPIVHLDMPGMTMVFTASDKAVLARVKPGDKIRFLVVVEGGQWLVTDIQPVP